MKTRYWILMFAVLALFSCVLSFVFLRPRDTAAQAQIFQNGILIDSIDLHRNQVFTVASPNGGFNEITVKGGKIAVTAASCPDHHCMHRGFCNSGAPIICLPNALEIRLVTASGPDLSTG